MMDVVAEEVEATPKLRFAQFNEPWRSHALGDVATFHDEKRVPIKEGDRTKRRGQYPYYGASGIIDYVDDFLFDGEYILLGEDGANIVLRNSPLAFVVSGKFWVNNHAHVIEANGSNHFLAEALELINYEQYNTGTAQPKLNASVCKRIKLNLPSLPEQQKIAAFLGAVDRKIQQLKRKQALLEQYKKGVVQQLFCQELRFKREDGSEYPDWEEKALGELGEFRTSSIDKLTEEGQKLVRLVNYMNVYRHEEISRRTVSEYMVVSATPLQIETCDLRRGDILFTPSSETPDDIGHSVVISEDLPDAVFSYHLMRFRPTVKLDLNYSHYFCNTGPVLKQISRFATGSTRFTVSSSSFAKVRVQVPCLEEQSRIAGFLMALDAKVAGVAQAVAAAEMWKKGLLQGMFV